MKFTEQFRAICWNQNEIMIDLRDCVSVFFRSVYLHDNDDDLPKIAQRFNVASIKCYQTNQRTQFACGYISMYFICYEKKTRRGLEQWLNKCFSSYGDLSFDELYHFHFPKKISKNRRVFSFYFFLIPFPSFGFIYGWWAIDKNVTQFNSWKWFIQQHFH